MPEIKDSHLRQPESLKPKIERFLKITNACISGEISPIDAFRQIVDRSPQRTETLEPQKPVSIQNEAESEQQKTNKEIEQIRQEISTITEEVKTKTEPVSDSRESLINKDEYYLQKEKELSGQGYITNNIIKIKDGLDFWQKYCFDDKIRSISTILKLKNQGVKNPREFYQTLHLRGYSNSEITDPKFINTCKIQELSPSDLSKGIDRIGILGFNSPYHHLSKLEPYFNKIIKTVSNIPDENFNNIISQLNPYTFLSKRNMNDSFWEVPSSPEKPNQFFDIILESLKTGNLDSEIKSRLDLTKECFLLYNLHYLDKYSITKIIQFPNKYEIQDNPDFEQRDDFLKDLLDKNNQVSLFLIDGHLVDKNILKSNFEYLFKNIKTDTALDNFIKILPKELTNQLVENNNTTDKEKIIFSIYKNILGEKDSLNNVDYIKNLFLKYNLDFSNFLDGDNPNNLFFETLIKRDIVFVPDLLKPDNLVSFSTQDKIFWTHYRDMVKNNKIYKTFYNFINSDFLKNNSNINRFFSENKSDFSKFLDENNNFNSLFLENLIKNDIYIPIEMLTEEKISNFSPKDKIFWKIIMDKNLNKKINICSDKLTKKLTINKDVLIKDISDGNFINSLFNQYGKKAEDIVDSYIDCISTGVISSNEKNLISDFLKDFRIISPAIISEYKKAIKTNEGPIFISHLKEITQKMISSKSLSESDTQKPYYIDLIKHVYSNNVGNWTTYESNNSCQDRSNDLGKFKIDDVYKIDLLSQSNIKVKENEILNENIPIELQNPIIGVMNQLKTLDFDSSKCNQYLEAKINEQFKKISNPEINLEKINSIEDRLFLLITESIYGSSPIDQNIIKDLMITYQFTKYEDIRNFINGTTDRVSYSNNKDYALLCELNAFYSDKIKDINKRIIESASKNKIIIDLMPKYFQKLNQQQSSQNIKLSIDKSQIDKLGLSQSFIDQITRTLNQREENKKYTPKEVKQLIYNYEEATEGLTLDFPSENKNTKAFIGQLRTQREKTFNVAKTLSQQEFNPSEIHLGEINLQQLIESQNNIKIGEYNEEQFISYTAQRFMDIFSDEVSKTKTELDKFISESGKYRELLNGYITKSKESANARMVGGVCVSGDNPDKNAEKNMWNMPEYFQFVFQDPDTLQCQGLVLMHHFIENGKKVLTVSLNPSSTYLYSVDENALFKGILSQLEKFASDNKFDFITTSQNNAIRTNRTGGEFEKAINEKIRDVNESFKFSESKTFSYKPSYQIQDMDIIWKSPTA